MAEASAATAGAAASVAVAAAAPPPKASCRAATSKPSGAQELSSAVVNRTVRNASPAAGSGATQPGSATVAVPPGSIAGSGNASPHVATPSTVSSYAARSHSVPMKYW